MDKKLRTHKDLEVWKNAINFVTLVYEVTSTFPGTEIYGLTNQLRRAAVSIPSNIAEGAARSTNKDNIHFLYISLGSISEVDTQFIISFNLGFISDEKLKEISDKLTLIKSQLLYQLSYECRTI